MFFSNIMTPRSPFLTQDWFDWAAAEEPKSKRRSSLDQLGRLDGLPLHDLQDLPPKVLYDIISYTII